MEENIKILEEKIEYWKKDPRIMVNEENFREIQAIENLIKGYKEKEKENKELWEANTKLGYEIGKRDAKINQLNKVIDKMAIYLADMDFDECCAEIPEPCLSCSWEDYEPHTNCIKDYFRKKVEE